MGVLTSPKTYAGLAAFQAADALACAAQVPPIKKSLDAVGCPDNVRRVLPPIKGAAALGLLSVRWFPGLARLTTAMLTLYFVLAVGAHVRARDKLVNALPAAALLTVFAAMTVQGPEASHKP
ncbi:DoxX family protein [Mycolicibacterium sp.]|uniref:DoxX family protein n=1 Tax=Mycolicibacterium sp. TaxID=2320850 RepID=UPI0025F9D8BC|nr:DoxX family protein [Mycolicibacterium sp.]MCB9409531.1 DoxX family protein [Mycolicibacterium sp.]